MTEHIATARAPRGKGLRSKKAKARKQSAPANTVRTLAPASGREQDR